MQESNHEYKGLAYSMEEIGGEFRFTIPYRKFTSEWYTAANSYGDPEKAAYQAAKWLIDVYVG